MKMMYQLFCYLSVFAIPFSKYLPESVKSNLNPYTSILGEYMKSAFRETPQFVMSNAPSNIMLCNEKGDLMTVQNVALNPDPPQKGANLSVVMTGIVNGDIVDGAYMLAHVKKGIKFPQIKFPICDYVVGGCPIVEGSSSVELQFEISKMLPGGTYEVSAVLYNKDESLKNLSGPKIKKFKHLNKHMSGSDISVAGARIACATGSIEF